MKRINREIAGEERKNLSSNWYGKAAERYIPNRRRVFN